MDGRTPFERLCENVGISNNGHEYYDDARDIRQVSGGLYFSYINGLVQEGLIKTYPANKFMKRLGGKYSKYFTDIEMVDAEGKQSVGVIKVRAKITLDETIIGMLKQKFETWGYRFSQRRNFYIRGELILLEAKYPVDVTKMVADKGLKVYHISPTRYTERIEEVGLIPKDSQTNFNYFGRTYLFTSQDKKFLQKLNDRKIQEDIVRMIGDVKNDIKNWTVYEVDVKRIKLYHDYFVLAEHIFSCFTVQNIGPDKLKVVREIVVK